MSAILIAAVGIALLLAAGVIIQFRLVLSQRRELKRQQQQIGFLQADIGALCAGAVGADLRVSVLEKQERSREVGNMGIPAQDGGRPYSDAIQLVKEGATPQMLAERLGLSVSEAELVVMLHGNTENI